MLQVFVRADASTIVGTGHVMRCLTLTRALSQTLDANITFICREFDGNLVTMLREQGVTVIALPVTVTPEHTGTGHDYRSWLGAALDDDAQQTLAAIQTCDVGEQKCLLITDHYAIDASWQRQLRPAVDHIVAIDDLANRPLDCDVLLDTTYSRAADDYDALIPSHSQRLTGSQYALLRPEFDHAAEQIIQQRAQRTERTRLLVMMGGTDPHNTTLAALQAVVARTDLQITAVVGGAMPHWRDVEALCAQHAHVKFLRAPNDIAELMLAHDFAIAAAGTTSWERCACGLPSLLVVQAENQVFLCQAIAYAGAAVALDLPLSAAAIQSRIDFWQREHGAYMDAVSACLQICDGAGTRRVVAAIQALATAASPST